MTDASSIVLTTNVLASEPLFREMVLYSICKFYYRKNTQFSGIITRIRSQAVYEGRDAEITQAVEWIKKTCLPSFTSADARRVIYFAKYKGVHVTTFIDIAMNATDAEITLVIASPPAKDHPTRVAMQKQHQAVLAAAVKSSMAARAAAKAAARIVVDPDSEDEAERQDAISSNTSGDVLYTIRGNSAD
jgi:hypothetical protein